MHSFSTGGNEEIGIEFLSVRVNGLDDASDEELASAPMNFVKGRDNAWWDKPKITCHL